MAIQPPLNDVQIMLLRLFSREMSQEELDAVRTLLLGFYERELQDEVERVIEEKNISTEDFQERLKSIRIA